MYRTSTDVTGNRSPTIGINTVKSFSMILSVFTP